jgi:hypothetical protein
MDQRIVYTIMNHLSNQWVTDSYAWQDDFLEEYFCSWVYSPKDCFDMVTKEEFQSIIRYNFEKGYPYKRMIDHVNQYVWLYAQECLRIHPDVQEKIQDILRVQKVKRMIPMVLSRYLPSDVIPLVWSFILWT